VAQRSMMQDDSLDDFAARLVAVDGTERRVYVAGEGPAVVVMAEMPGISPHLARFARWIRDAGFTVYLPSLFGRDGAVGQADEGAALFRQLCVSAEFNILSAGRTSPVTQWLRGLARIAHAECGGPGVGAIGMCLTGNFALSMMLEPSVLAPVLSQPSLPYGEPEGLEISEEDLTAVRARLDREDLTVLAYRFEGDRVCTRQRFEAYSRALGDRFQPRTLPDAAAASDQVPPFFAEHVPYPHSVLTVHLVDEAGSPTAAARDEVIDFFRTRLAAPVEAAQPGR
jgi:dienelactone hydrolase